MTGMENVLRAHAVFAVIEGGWRCVCGETPERFADSVTHVAEALTAAGFGSQHDAWVEGHEVGLAYAANDHNPPNPYPAPKVSEA